MGLLSMLVSNVAAYFTSQFPHSVGGTVLPVIPIMATYFAVLGPENCPTVMFAMPLITVICGALTVLVGRFGGVQDLVKACPFVVFGGFIAGCGAQLLEFATALRTNAASLLKKSLVFVSFSVSFSDVSTPILVGLPPLHLNKGLMRHFFDESDSAWTALLLGRFDFQCYQFGGGPQFQ